MNECSKPVRLLLVQVATPSNNVQHRESRSENHPLPYKIFLQHDHNDKYQFSPYTPDIALIQQAGLSLHHSISILVLQKSPTEIIALKGSFLSMHERLPEIDKRGCAQSMKELLNAAVEITS